MISWKVEISDLYDNDGYRKTVESYVSPAMDYLCERLNENDLTNFESTEDLFKKIFDELPIMNFKKGYKGTDFFIQYNKYTNIYFEDSASCVRRDIILNNLFKDDEKI